MFTLTIEDRNGQVANKFSFTEGNYVVGRNETCDVVLPSTSVSREHARIFVHQGRCYIEDLGSANGVIVDGQKVVRQRDLGAASQIRVGDYYLYLEYQRPVGADQRVLQTLFIPKSGDHPKLVRINDSFAGEEFSLSELENTIGRTDDNFILLSDPSISRHHATIEAVGERFSVRDLGSSNGTRVNGKKLKDRATLKFGDRVEFGNVEFVFAEGNAQINPAAYTRKSSGNVSLIAGLAVLVLIGLALGGAIVYGFVALKKQDAAPQAAADTPQAGPEDTLDGRIAALIARGERQMERREWEVAIATFDDALALSPENAAAAEGRARAVRERDAEAMLEKGEILSEQGKHEEARAALLEVPEGTEAHQRASSTLNHLNKTIAYNLRTEATRLMKDGKKKDLLEAHQLLERSLSLVPDDEDTTRRLETLRARMKKKGISPPKD